MTSSLSTTSSHSCLQTPLLEGIITGCALQELYLLVPSLDWNPSILHTSLFRPFKAVDTIGREKCKSFSVPAGLSYPPTV